MKKVYQTIVDKDIGNCTQAVFASLLDLELDQVPNFIMFKERWFEEVWKFIHQYGYTFEGTLYNGKAPAGQTGKVVEHHTFPTLKEQKGINGYFYASVYSPKYYTRQNLASHAVIVDKDCNIIHDPNPEYAGITSYPEADIIGYCGVTNVSMINPIVKEEYYLQNKQAGFVGNCCLFWRKKGSGYTCDLDDAEIMTKEEAEENEKSSQGKFVAWKKSELDAIAKRHIDVQNLRRINAK